MHTAIRGFLANIFNVPPLLLTFQWNPMDVSESKSVSYNKIELGGHIAPIRVFSHGDDLSFRFSLFFDATDNTSVFNVFRVVIPGIGVAAPIQMLLSFLYPSTLKIFDPTEMGFGEPPSCYFGVGPRVLKGHVTKVDIEYHLYDSLLVPKQATAKVEFVASEDGAAGMANAIFRRAAAFTDLGRL